MATSDGLSEALHLLCGKTKLERDRGLVKMQAVIDVVDEELIRNIEKSLIKIIESEEEWEQKQGALFGAKLVIEHAKQLTSESFSHQIKQHALNLLNDKEARVRLAAGEVLGSLCKSYGPEIYVTTKDTVLEGVRNNLERKSVSESEGSNEDRQETEMILEKLSSSPRREDEQGMDASKVFHDTAGWKHLETWMRCLQSMVEGCGWQFTPYITQDLLSLVFQTLQHTNRFVRETCYQLCASLVACKPPQDPESMETEDEMLSDDNTILVHGDQFAHQLAIGLADNWSQVRMAASVATRQFLLHLPEDGRGHFYGQLLPRMCLNRYYVAEGVRIYSQETWRLVTGDQGRKLVGAHIQDTVDYYISQTKADNHAVREAACACIAELGSKIDVDLVRPLVADLLVALLECFRDQSWPVRDAACIACGNFVRCFPEESRSSMETLYPLFYDNLEDNIASVRQGAAVALTNVARAYGEEAIPKLLEKIKEGLVNIERQPSTTEKYSGLDKGPATFGVVKRLRDNDPDLHTSQQMYSCGSLAPKMGRGGGCMDHQFRTPSEPWETADGCFLLLAELSSLSVGEMGRNVYKLLPTVAEASMKKDYPQHIYFLENICQQLPVIAKNIGKKFFKPSLEQFFEPIFYSLSCDNALTSSAASSCLQQLGTFLGPNILRGRVEQYDPRFLEMLDPALGSPGMPRF